MLALDAAQIQPYGDGGPHHVVNGLLLRADLHRLFDHGYLTVTTDRRILLGRRLLAHYHIGRSYYPLDGSELRSPQDPEYLRWHDEEVFVA